MRWQRLGRVFQAAGQEPWMRSHAANPVAEHLDGDRFRIYFGCRDDKNRTHIGSVDVAIDAQVRVVDVAREPVLTPGKAGQFDDSGTSMACLVQHESATYLFYVGWNLAVTVPF